MMKMRFLDEYHEKCSSVAGRFALDDRARLRATRALPSSMPVSSMVRSSTVDQRKFGGVKWGAVLEGQMWKCRRTRCTALHEARIATDPPGRKYTSSYIRRIGRCTVNGAKIEGDRVSRRHVPATDDELIALSVNVRYVLE